MNKEKQEVAEKYNPSANVEEIEKEGLKKENSGVLVSLNNASIAELETLSGIGTAYAERIIEYRETNGGFASVEDLVNVKGIGTKTLEKLKPFIKL